MKFYTAQAKFKAELSNMQSDFNNSIDERGRKSRTGSADKTVEPEVPCKNLEQRLETEL